MRSFVLGNGTSRLNINPQELQRYGKIYGCNALYRDFLPDVLVATDKPIATEIQNSGYSIKNKFGADITDDKISIVLVIITDGHENSSRLYSYHDIANLIKQLDETGKWTFSFLGADFDAIHTSQMLNIRRENVMNFSKSEYSGMMDDVSDSIRTYAQEKSVGNLKRDIFDIFKTKDRRNN
jgi:hypothetical protein